MNPSQTEFLFHSGGRLLHNGRIMIKKIALYIATLLAASSSASAMDVTQPPDMILPIECELGWNCWISNYVDHDRGPDGKDYMCGQQTRNRQKGTDFMIRNFREMMGGIVVRAAADGVVLGKRDGMKDVHFKKVRSDQLKKKECGNGLRLQHEGGWITQYCHMRKNSVKVEKGDQVKQGDILGFVGNSGMAEYPHLDFRVEYIEPGSGARSGAVVDPFVGVARNNQCMSGEHALWPLSVIESLSYWPVNIVDSGFATTKPNTEAMIEGLYDDEALSVRAPQLVLWARLIHVKQGDKVTFTISNPDGEEIFSYSNTIDEDKAHTSLHAGMRRPSLEWDGGAYSGMVKLQRQGEGVFRSEAKVSLR